MFNRSTANATFPPNATACDVASVRPRTYAVGEILDTAGQRMRAIKSRLSDLTYRLGAMRSPTKGGDTSNRPEAEGFVPQVHSFGNDLHDWCAEVETMLGDIEQTA